MSLRPWLIALLTLSCEGVIVRATGTGGSGAGSSGGSGGTGTGGTGGSATPTLSTLDVFTRLKPTCAGCHTLDMRPYFADLPAFENLIVYDLRWVTPGNPDASGFIALLRGLQPNGRQMPPAPADRFELLSEKGQTQITLEEVRTWIRNLPARPDAGVPVDPVLLHRKSAEQIRVALYAQLGLTEDDLLRTLSTGSLPYRVDARFPDGYALRSSDAITLQNPAEQAGSLYSALGGAHFIEGKLPNNAVTPNALQALVPISQAWCRTALTKPGNTALLKHATLSDDSTTPAGAAAVKQNIGYLYLKMLGLPPTPDEIDDLYQNVFALYEEKGTTVAWVAVCSALIRDPLWILY